MVVMAEGQEENHELRVSFDFVEIGVVSKSAVLAGAFPVLVLLESIPKDAGTMMSFCGRF